MLGINRTWWEVIIGLLALSSVVGLWVYHDSAERKIGAATCQAAVTQTKREAAADATAKAAEYELQVAEANAKLKDTIAALPPPINQPLVLQYGAICGSTVPAPAKTANTNPVAPGTKQGPGGRDIRPELEVFKLKYETALAQCQANLDKWPTGVAK